MYLNCCHTLDELICPFCPQLLNHELDLFPQPANKQIFPDVGDPYKPLFATIAGRG